MTSNRIRLDNAGPPTDTSLYTKIASLEHRRCDSCLAFLSTSLLIVSAHLAMHSCTCFLATAWQSTCRAERRHPKPQWLCPAPHSAFCRGRSLRRSAANGSRCTAFFKLGGQTSNQAGAYPRTATPRVHVLVVGFGGWQHGLLSIEVLHQWAGVYGSQTRDDYNSDDVEQYFNYMGMLATEVQRGCVPCC